MLIEQFHQAVATVRTTAQLDTVARQLWAAHGQGAIDDEAAEGIAGALQGRRAAFSRQVAGLALAAVAPVSARRRPPRSPNRQRSLERRRRCAASGAVPARIAANFTPGEIAVLSVVAGQVRKAGQCSLPIDALAALAGVCRSTVKSAVRLAERLGLILRIERRRAGQRSETNILRIIAADWVTWLRIGGKNSIASNNQVLPKGRNGRAEKEKATDKSNSLGSDCTETQAFRRAS